ncbi:DUF805 domain-containing protein [Sphingomonas desiccabilis]|uniref:DUF805 domain-containing protein n=1 Tax=Sphingomonas desiccabilis TaxID=429134 RepID=A0A4Q2IZS8_9SPHN|nr:DUF805 domain-containing protein [Sphingomonas desiccabilis]MBB3910045.1 uncharacterized membrane protein YhaH (DUF805 family) [Sphingomonas desiccabilis]RXZ34741.1 DUF805 domain-containing protein [Sphingomonas desiccabilis]
MHWMLLPLKRYADFSGRSRRLEFWMFQLFYLVVITGLTTLAFLMGDGPNDPSIVPLLMLGLFIVGTIVPAIAVQVRRFHDQDRSGLFVLLNFIPYAGGLIVFVFMVLPGTRGSNRFGPDPVFGEREVERVFT